MAKRQILFAGCGHLKDQVVALFAQISQQLECVFVDDGAGVIREHTRLAASGSPALVVAIQTQLSGIGGAESARLIRALERGLQSPASAILLLCDEGENAELMVRDLGRAVSLPMTRSLSDEQAAHRLVKAVNRILSQLRKRGRG